MSGYEVIRGDCREVLVGMEAESVDAVVTDPPYGLSFMGKSWDHAVPGPEYFEAMLRVLADGGRLLCFAGTRTMHRMWCAIEDAGFTIEDTVMWLYGTGFPKHGSKLKPAYEPICVARKGGASDLNIDACRIGTTGGLTRHTRKREGSGPGWHPESTGEITDNGGRWPANVALSHRPECEPAGTRRVQTGTARREKSGGKTFGTDEDKPPMPDMTYADDDGRETVEAWDCHPECPVRMLDEQSGIGQSAPQGRGTDWGAHGGRIHSTGLREHAPSANYSDTGGASRFFYVAKASRAEREAGLEGLAPKPIKHMATSDGHRMGREASEGARSRSVPDVLNPHPTVKPVALMRWLVRLVTPPGGTVLDPFCGSGTTGVACTLEGFDFVGIEREPEYVEIARRRIANTQPSLFSDANTGDEAA